MLSKSKITALVKRLRAASLAYHSGATPLMTDAEFDAELDILRTADPDNSFLSEVGAPVPSEDAVPLPFPLPSLSKIKPDDGSLEKWFDRNPAATYLATLKMDGISALWIPSSRSLFTRGDGVEGRDISAFVPFIKMFKGGARGGGAGTGAIRGELVMRTDSTFVPSGMLARNVVAGALNRKGVSNTALLGEIQFIAYEIVQPVDTVPSRSLAEMAAMYHVVDAVTLENKSALALSATFTRMEAASPYQADGIVVVPDVARPSTWVPALKRLADGKTTVQNPADRVAWKTRESARTADVTVREVVWSVTKDDNLIPVVNFDTVLLSGANLTNATGLHGRWIFENRVGPEARIRIQRSGDTIPRILEVLSPAPGGPQMPATEWCWSTADEDTSVHVKPAPGTLLAERAQVRLVHALGELGAENVGPGVVERLYAGGFRTIHAIYAASVADLAATPGFKETGAQRVWTGLRAGQKGWTQLTFLVASCTMPRGVGARKLQALLDIESDVVEWPTSLKNVAVPGLGPQTVDAILAAVPLYLEWCRQAGLKPQPRPQSQPRPMSQGQFVVVFTDVRDKPFEAALESAGHTVADTVTKKTTHVVYPDGDRPTTTKITKAIAVGAQTRTLSQMKKLV